MVDAARCLRAGASRFGEPRFLYFGHLQKLEAAVRKQTPKMQGKLRHEACDIASLGALAEGRAALGDA